MHFKNREPNNREISLIIRLTKHIQKEAERRGVSISKRRAHKLAVQHLGFIDRRYREEAVREQELLLNFRDGLRSTDARYKRPA